MLKLHTKLLLNATMATFSENSFKKKLSDLNSSSQSIQTLSLWLIHHRKHSKQIVQMWMKEMKRVKATKRLTLLYLCNDVIQNSKKKGPEFNRDFKTVLPDVYKNSSKDVDTKTKAGMERMATIWKERNIFSADFVGNLQKEISREDPKKDSSVSSSPATTPVPKETTAKSKTKPPKKPATAKPAVTTAASDPPKKKKKVELSLREEIELEGHTEAGDPPEADDLVKALQELDDSASSDAAVRERIAAFPPDVSDISKLDMVKDKAAADCLAANVDEAVTLLTEYNGRLAGELQDRKRVAIMLRDYIAAQRQSLTLAESRLLEHKSKLEKVDSVRKELKSHIQSLPDLTLLPDVTGGLAPLPSAGDLFAIEKGF